MSPHKSPPCGLQTSPGGVWKKLYVLFCIWSQRDPLHDNIIDVFCRQLSQVVFTNFVWCCTGNSIYFIHPINIDRELLLKLTPISALRYSCPMSIIITETDPVLIAIIALCGYPIVKREIRDSSQIPTTAPILLLYNYFRQKYLEIASCTVSLLKKKLVRDEHSLLEQLNLQKINCSSSSLQAGCE